MMDVLKQAINMSFFHFQYFFNSIMKLFISTAFFQLVFMTSVLPTLSMDKTYKNSNGNINFSILKQIHYLNNSTLNVSLHGLEYEHSKVINDLIENINYLQSIITKDVSFESSLWNKPNMETNSKKQNISRIQRKLNFYQHELDRILGDLEKQDYIPKHNVGGDLFRVLEDLDKDDFIREDGVHVQEIVWRERHQGVLRSKRAATAITDKLWEYGVIPYVIEPVFTSRQKELFLGAMETWEKFTCLVFKEKEEEDRDYLIFTVRPCGCCSSVGRVGNGGQVISIGKNCSILGIVLHELGHVIGFWHEHTRPDRDKFVEILLDNVQADKKSNFDALSSFDINSLDEPYDFESIMHYSRNTFANRPYLDTLLAKRLPGMAVRPDIGQRLRLSPGDIRQTNKLYNCTRCGITLQKPSGNLHYASKLGHSELCQWRITGSHGERIKLNVTSLNITYSDNCANKYLEIRDGHYIKSPSLGRFCGHQTPGIIISSGRRLWIEFKTNGGLDEFSAEYVTFCGGTIIKDEGFIASPGYPNTYPPDSLCVWNITVQKGFVVGIKFESLGLEDDCTHDFLEIRDGHGNNAKVLGKYCGKKHPQDVQSTGNIISLVFKSDSEGEKAGFFVSFVKEMDECSTESHGCDHVCINTIGSYKCECKIGFELYSDGKTCSRECGGDVFENKGSITSPFFPEKYPRNKQCIWTIIAPKDHIISLNFTNFDLEGNSENCYFDYVAVNQEDGNDPRKNILYCGNVLPKPILTSGNILKIEFKSDDFDEKSGFSALFATDYNECEIKNGGCGQICKNTIGSFQCYCISGYILQNDHQTCLEGCQKDISVPKGIITSPDYPNVYPRNLECEWRISTVLGHRLRLSFKVLDIEPQVECQYDHVIVFDGDNRNTTILGRYCGSTFPEQIISSGMGMLLFFATDNSVQRKGFEAEHDTVCGNILYATFEPKTLVSHAGYGFKNYEAWEDCEWLFVASDGMKVEIDFEFFDLEAHAECQYDYMAIYDGDNDNSNNLGVHCGRSVPLSLVSSTNYLFLAFMTDNTVNRKGFQLRFLSVAKAPKITEFVN